MRKREESGYEGENGRERREMQNQNIHPIPPRQIHSELRSGPSSWGLFTGYMTGE